MTTIPWSNVTYFKRFRMERDLVLPPPPVPALPPGCAWASWNDNLLDTHARVKHTCFCDEIDGIVFPNLSCLEGCLRLMHDIRQRPGFCAGATWLILRGGEPLGTVQGVSDKHGCGAIQNLGIVPSQRGSGLGTALLLQALHGFRRSGLERAMLEVTAQNAGAIRLYRRHGFRFRKTLYKMVEAASSTYPLAPAPPDWCV
jgi:ribosomal protein S18 acetylase RimI-like enzyme